MVASPGPGCHQSPFDTGSKGVFRHGRVNFSFPGVAGKVSSNSVSEMGFAILKGC